jgi:hypothetical protein
MELSLPTTSPADVLTPLDKSRLQAEINLLFIQEEIGRRVLDPTMHTKDLFAAGEHSYKVSGMAVKQAEKVTGPGFSITINIPSVGGGPAEKLVFSSDEHPPEGGDTPADMLAALPDFMRGTVGNLSHLID